MISQHDRPYAELLIQLISRFALAQEKEERAILLAFFHLLEPPFDTKVKLSIGPGGETVLSIRAFECPPIDKHDEIRCVPRIVQH